MSAAVLNLSGRKFVVIPEKEYRQLKAQAARKGKPPQIKRRLSKRDRGDVAESLRRLADPARVPAEEVFRKLGA